MENVFACCAAMWKMNSLNLLAANIRVKATRKTFENATTLKRMLPSSKWLENVLFFGHQIKGIQRFEKHLIS